MTPATICTALVVAGVLVLAVIAAMTYLTVRGLDPDPMLRLTAQVGGGLVAAINLWVSLAARVSGAKTERYVGQLAAREAAGGRHAAPETEEGPLVGAER